MVDVEHCALRALEQDAVAAPPRFVQLAPHGLHERRHLGRDFP
ncbi:MAG TPA: hypothetical protein VFE34_06145 [Dongiaceae bacterium]|nr:hypothetical protein [Dongiaceae bacterium]